MAFPPVAIVGRACVLPGALSPAALWQAVREGRDLLGTVPAGRWGVPPGTVLCAAAGDSQDRTWSDRGGYVEGFESVFDPEGFAIPADEIRKLDPLFQWVFHCAREALREASHPGSRDRVGAIFGNLSFPSATMNRYAELYWLRENGLLDEGLPHPRNCFTSGLPALLLERALGLPVALGTSR